jgi:hypothetical protein
MADKITPDELEDDWEILRRSPEDEAFPTTLNMAEAIERVCKAIVEYAILIADDPHRTKKDIENNNKFPTFTVIPYYDASRKKRLWKVTVTYELIETKYTSAEHDCCERAVEELFNSVSAAINKKAKDCSEEAEGLEKEVAETRDTSRKLRRIGSSMGSYTLVQPNLNLTPKQEP